MVFASLLPLSFPLAALQLSWFGVWLLHHRVPHRPLPQSPLAAACGWSLEPQLPRSLPLGGPLRPRLWTSPPVLNDLAHQRCARRWDAAGNTE